MYYIIVLYCIIILYYITLYYIILCNIIICYIILYLYNIYMCLFINYLYLLSIYIYLCLYIHIFICTFIHIYTCAQKYMYMHTCICHLCVCGCVSIISNMCSWKKKSVKNIYPNFSGFFSMSFYQISFFIFPLVHGSKRFGNQKVEKRIFDVFVCVDDDPRIPK